MFQSVCHKHAVCQILPIEPWHVYGKRDSDQCSKVKYLWHHCVRALEKADALNHYDEELQRDVASAQSVAVRKLTEDRLPSGWQLPK